MAATLGQMVHYVSRGTIGQMPKGTDVAALVIYPAAQVDGPVTLYVFDASAGARIEREVVEDHEAYEPGTWHFPGV